MRTQSSTAEALLLLTPQLSLGTADPSGLLSPSRAERRSRRPPRRRLPTRPASPEPADFRRALVSSRRLVSRARPPGAPDRGRGRSGRRRTLRRSEWLRRWRRAGARGASPDEKGWGGGG